MLHGLDDIDWCSLVRYLAFWQVFALSDAEERRLSCIRVMVSPELAAFVRSIFPRDMIMAFTVLRVLRSAALVA